MIEDRYGTFVLYAADIDQYLSYTVGEHLPFDIFWVKDYLKGQSFGRYLFNNLLKVMARDGFSDRGDYDFVMGFMPNLVKHDVYFVPLYHENIVFTDAELLMKAKAA